MEDKIKIFVSRHWPDRNYPINVHIINLIKGAGMEVSDEIKNINTGIIEHKMHLNILSADAFCIIVNADENGALISRNVQHEIAVAKTYNIPAFVFVDRTEMGKPTTRPNIEGLCFGLKMASYEWHEFYDKELLDGKDDRKIHNWLVEIKNSLSHELHERRLAKALPIVALLTHKLNLTPFNVGLKSIAEAYDKDSALIYDAAAKVAAELTGAKLGFIGFLERENSWNKLSIRGVSGLDDEERAVVSSIKLGYNDSGQTEGITGHVAYHGKPYMISDIERESEGLENAGIKFINSPQKEKTNSELCIPISLKSKVIGIINVEHSHQNYFNEVHKIILEWLSSVIALAYSGNQLEHFIQELGEVAQGKKKIGETILHALLRFSQADHGFVAITNRKTKICEIVAIEKRGLAEDMIVVDPEKGLSGKVLKEGVPAYIDDVKINKEYLPVWPDTLSEIVLPIINSKAVVVGIINLEFKNRQTFKFIDKRLFESIAKLIAPYIPG